MHVVARGALIGGGVGAVLAVVRGRGAEADAVTADRFAKSIAEGALAGASVGLVFDRRVRSRAMALAAAAAERSPGLVDSIVETVSDAFVDRLTELRSA
jgi:hypothetical protein